MIASELLTGCALSHYSTPKRHTLVLSYQDFGPQAAAYELIGFEWYQWNSHGSDKPAEHDDVKVVVYRDIPLADVKRRYPVLQGRQDYRYVTYEAAIAYCDLMLQEHRDLLGHLRNTKQKIQHHFDRN